MTITTRRLLRLTLLVLSLAPAAGAGEVGDRFRCEALRHVLDARDRVCRTGCERRAVDQPSFGLDACVERCRAKHDAAGAHLRARPACAEPPLPIDADGVAGPFHPRCLGAARGVTARYRACVGDCDGQDDAPRCQTTCRTQLNRRLGRLFDRRMCTAPSAEPRAIIGGNDLVTVDASGSNLEARYRGLLDAIGRLSVPVGAGVSANCTATHLGNGIAITSGHCFGASSSRQNFVGCSGATVLWGYRADRAPLQSRCMVVLAMQDSKPTDYAIFEVDPAPEARVAYQADAGNAFARAVGSQGTLLAHPGGGVLQWSNTCWMAPPWGNPITHTCDTLQGTSGGVMLDTGDLRAVGINGWETSGLNWATALGSTPLRDVASTNPPASRSLMGLGGKCLDVSGANSANRTPLILYPCHGEGNQLWTPVGNSIRGLAGKCLDMPYNQNGSGTWLFDCWGGWNQQWAFTNFTIRGFGNKCVDDPLSTPSGTQTQTWDCHGGANQRFTYTATGQIRDQLGRCLDIPWSTANGTPVVAYPCHDGANQRWQLLPNGTIRGFGGKCLDVRAYGTSNGTKLQIWDCYGGANQRFTLRGEVRNTATNKCLDIPWNTANGAPATVWDCHGGWNQQWAYFP